MPSATWQVKPSRTARFRAWPLGSAGAADRPLPSVPHLRGVSSVGLQGKLFLATSWGLQQRQKRTKVGRGALDWVHPDLVQGLVTQMDHPYLPSAQPRTQYPDFLSTRPRPGSYQVP